MKVGGGGGERRWERVGGERRWERVGGERRWERVGGKTKRWEKGVGVKEMR